VKLWVSMFALFAAYIGVIWYMPLAGLWSLVPTYLMAMPHTTVYQHRCMTHRAIKMKPWLRTWSEILGWLSIGSNTDAWVAAHRVHHKFSDKLGDPHSPRFVREDDGTYRVANGMEGLVPAIFPFNVVPWRNWLRENQSRIKEISADVIAMQSPLTTWMRKYPTLGLAIGVALICGVTWLVHGNPLIGLAAAFLHFVGFVFIFNPLINGLCHYPHKPLGGYQHTKATIAKDTFNNLWVAALTGGEGFHHNHHWEQATGRFAKYWYEMPFDTGYWMYIVPGRWFGWIWDVKLPKQEPI
jgi:fatty-acid desaturase